MHPPLTPQNPLHLPAQTLTLRCPLLDRLLSGGLPTSSLTEIAGESSSGKTQLCLQLLLAALLPPSSGGLSAASLYIHSEFPFPLRRLRRLPLPLPTSLDHIFVRAAHSPEDLITILSDADTLLAHPRSGLPIRLIIIDSIAALFRSEFDNIVTDLRRRSTLFFKIAAQLKEQARRFNLAVVVTNQVVDVVGDGANAIQVGNYGELWSSGRRVCSALGMSWANCVNTRLFLSRMEEVVGDGEVGWPEVRTRRRMHVVFAPHLPEGSCEFVIVQEGVFGLLIKRYQNHISLKNSRGAWSQPANKSKFRVADCVDH